MFNNLPEQKGQRSEVGVSQKVLYLGNKFHTQVCYLVSGNTGIKVRSYPGIQVLILRIWNLHLQRQRCST
jgi:hypothetical protein